MAAEETPYGWEHLMGGSASEVIRFCVGAFDSVPQISVPRSSGTRPKMEAVEGALVMFCADLDKDSWWLLRYAGARSRG